MSSPLHDLAAELSSIRQQLDELKDLEKKHNERVMRAAFRLVALRSDLRDLREELAQEDLFA